MASYFRLNPDSFGKGFITHKDHFDLSFEILGDVATVGGAEGDAAAWAARVGAGAISEKEASDLKAQYKHDGALAEVLGLESRLAEAQTKESILLADLSATKEYEATK